MPVRRPRLKLVRRFGTPLPGLTRKEPGRTHQAPGQHGPASSRRRPSTYALRLAEKQKLRFNYGVSERQLRRYFARALRAEGVTGEVLLSLLESRLDSVVFRLGFAATIPAARQMVGHGHVRVNGQRVDRPGLLLAPGDEVSLSERGRRIADVAAQVEKGPELRLPGYLQTDPADRFTGRVLRRPARSDAPLQVDEAAIVEFYAR